MLTQKASTARIDVPQSESRSRRQRTITSIDWNPYDSSQIVATSHDKTVTIWNITAEANLLSITMEVGNLRRQSGGHSLFPLEAPRAFIGLHRHRLCFTL